MTQVLVPINIWNPGPRADELMREIAEIYDLADMGTGVKMAHIRGGASTVEEGEALVTKRLDESWPDWREHLTVG
jgi:hypothetical protein